MQMTPSQLHEIDCAIAKAMGKSYDIYNSNPPVCLLRDTLGIPWRPTQDPADAMEVLGWLCAQGNSVVLEKYKGKQKLWHCWRIGSLMFGQGKTPQIAISLFAHKIITSESSK